MKDQNGSSIGIKISDDVENVLTQLFYNPRSPVAFSGVAKIYNYLKNNKDEFEDLKKIIKERYQNVAKQTRTLYLPSNKNPIPSIIQSEGNSVDLG